MKSNKKQNKFNKVMGEFGKGTLKTSAGDKVTDRKQALAIAYSESGLDENEEINNKKMNKIKIKESELVDLVHSIVNRVIKEDIENDEPFVAHGAYTLGNAGGYEIMLSDDGEAARVRDAFGSENPITSDWLPIEYEYDEESGDYEAMIDPGEDGHYNIPLNQVMRVNRFNESKQPKKIKIKESELRNLIQTIAKRVISEGVEDEEFISIEQLIDIANKAGDYVIDAKDAIEDLGIAYGEKIPTSRVVEVLRNYDLTIDYLYNGEEETYDWNFSINDGEKINRILQANNVDYEYRRDGDEIIFTFPTRDEKEKLFPLIKKAVENGELKLKGEDDPNYDWIHDDMFESKKINKFRIKESELKSIIKEVVNNVFNKTLKEEKISLEQEDNMRKAVGKMAQTIKGIVHDLTMHPHSEMENLLVSFVQNEDWVDKLQDIQFEMEEFAKISSERSQERMNAQAMPPEGLEGFGY